jgi:hypothetical protein
LLDVKRPIVFFNRVGTTIDSVARQEVGNWQAVQLRPGCSRCEENELLTSAAASHPVHFILGRSSRSKRRRRY